METIKLALQFLASSTPVPPGPDPTPGGGGSSPVAQTGDLNVLLFFLVLFVALAAVLTLFLAARAKIQGTNMRSVAVNTAFKFATNTKLAIIGALVIAAIALLCGVTLVNAFAAQNEVNPDAINVYVDEDTGVITSIDQGTYTNQTGKNIAVQDIATQITSEAKSIEGLDQVIMTAKIGEQIFYQGKLGSSYKPQSTITVANGQTLTFTFEFKDLGSTIAKSLIGKTAIELGFSEAGYHTVTYDGNGATSGQPPVPAVKVDDTTAYISGNTGGLVKGEATFNGWNTNAEGTGTPYVEGQQYTANEDLTLYAMYKEPTSDVTLTYKIINEYQDMSHGSVALNSGGTADWQVTETFNPDSGTPTGATATPKSSEENGKFGNWEFSHWSITQGADEVCVSESANFVPTLETLGLTTWADTTITAHFGMAAAVFDPNAETLTFKYTEDESVFENNWAMPVYKDAHINIAQQEFKLPSWFTSPESGATLQCYPRTAIIEKDFKHYKGITSLDMWFASSNTLGSLYNRMAFVENRKLDKIEGLENIDTSEVVSTVAMFADNCSKLSRPVSLVGETKTSFKTIDLSSWVTPKLKDTSYMFADCWNLQQVLLPTDQASTTGSFGSTVENMDDMFLFCNSLETLNISTNFGAHAKTTNDMFSGCTSLKTIDAPNGNNFLSSCTECSYIFGGCESLRKIDLSNLKVDNNTEQSDIEGALVGCSGLRYVTVGANTTWTNNNLNLYNMGLQNEDYDENGIWYSTDDGAEIAKKAEDIPATDFSKSSKVTYRTLCSKAVYSQTAKSLTFYYDHKLYTDVEFSIDTALNTKYMNLVNEGDPYEMYDKPIFPEWYSYTATANGREVDTYDILNESSELIPNLQLDIQLAIDATNVGFDPSFKNSNDLYSMAFFFMADSNGKQTFKNFSGWANVNTINICSFACMFGGFSYKSIVENSASEDIHHAVRKISNHSELDDNLFINTYSNDTYSTSLESIDIHELDFFGESSNEKKARGALNLDYMFANSPKLTSVLLPSVPQLYMENGSYFSIPVTANHMFENCSSLESVPTSFNGYSLAYAQYMFWNCSSLKTADLSGINVNPDTEWDDYGYNMFLGCNNLKTFITNEYWCWKMSECGLIETWPEGEAAESFNPWKLEGKDKHVYEIPFNEYGEIANHGTFIREENIKGMTQATVTSADSSRGTVSTSAINFVGDVVVLPLADGSLKVGDAIVTANANEGFELAYWSLNGKKILDSGINGKLSMISAEYRETNQFQAHFKKLNYTPKAVYNNTTKTMTMFYDDQTHEADGTVFDINENTYIQNIGSLWALPSAEGKWLSNDTDNGTSINVYYGSWQFNNFEISLPTWYEFSQDNENQRFRINCKVNAETVVFDSTFAEYDELRSISMWFMADSDNDQTFKTFKSVDEDGSELAPFANLNSTSIQNVEYAFGGLYLNRYFEVNKNQSPIGKLFSGDIFGDPADSVVYNSSYNTYGNSIENIDMSGFNFSNLQRMDWMFANCQGVKKISFDENFDTSNLISMKGVFNNCENCKEILGLNSSKVNTKNVTNMDNLFQGCSHLTSLDLSSFDTTNVYKNQEFFIIIEKGEGFRSLFTHNKMFLDCVRLKEIKIKSTYDPNEYSWTGWTLYMDMCDLPSNSDLDDNWKVNGQGTSYSPFSIPLIIDANSPTSQNDLIQGTITRTPPEIFKVNIKTADSSQGQIGYIDTLDDEWEYDYINSINIATVQGAPAAAADAPAEISNAETTVAALYVDDRTYFAVPSDGYELQNWTATWEDGSGTPHTWVLNNQGALNLTGDDKAHITVTASFKEKGAEAWALLSEDSNGNGYFSFRYDRGVYAPGTQLEITLGGNKLADTTVIKAYNVTPNHDDYNFPAWYENNSILAYNRQDPHTYIPAIDEEFSKYTIQGDTPNPLTIVFEDNFKNFNTLESLSCFFMQATKESDGYSALVTPFAFDAGHFKGLNNICMDNVWNVKYMFGGHEYFNDINGSKTFEDIDLTGLDMNHLNNLDAMFANCLNLKHITFPEDFTGQKITSMYKTFFNCDALYGEDLYNVLSQIEHCSPWNMSYMFAKRHFDTTKRMPQNEAVDLTYIFPSSFEGSSADNVTRMFAGNEFAKSINIVTKSSFFESFIQEQSNAYNKVDATGMFEGCTSLETITAGNNSWFKDLHIASAVNMFAYCYSLTNQVPSQLGTAGFPTFIYCNDMYGMFQSCTSLTEFVPYGGERFRPSSVMYMNYMFANSGLINFVVGQSGCPSSFDTTNVVEFEGMFSNCSQLQNVNLKREDIKNTKLIVDAEAMFMNCYSIQSLTLKNIIFDSDENYNKSRYVPRTFKWDNDREDSSWGIVSSGTYHPYSNMFSGISPSGSIQSFEIDNNWNGVLANTSSPAQSGGLMPIYLNKDYDCAFPTTYEVWDESLETSFTYPLLWDLSHGKTHLIGEAGDITKLKDGVFSLPFGYGKFFRVKDNRLYNNSFIKIYRNIGSGLATSIQKGVTAANLSVSLTSPTVTIPDGFQIKYIDLTNCTNIQYKFVPLTPEISLERTRYKMILKVTYADMGEFTYEITPSATSMQISAPNVWYMGDIYNGGATKLNISTDFQQYPLQSIKPNCLLTIDSEWNPYVNDNVNVPELNDGSDAAASADETAQAQAPAVEGEDFAVDDNAVEGSNDDLLWKVEDALQEAADVCMWIFFLFVV